MGYNEEVYIEILQEENKKLKADNLKYFERLGRRDKRIEELKEDLAREKRISRSLTEGQNRNEIKILNLINEIIRLEDKIEKLGGNIK